MLDNLLGELDGYFSSGELHNIWDESWARRRCGCGAYIDECEVWGPVLTRVASAHPEAKPEGDVARWQRSMSKVNNTGRVLRSAGRGDVGRYAAVTERLYREVAAQTGASVIVDSSKRPPYAALLPGMEVESYVLHLVRDPRAVAHSWQRPKLEEPLVHSAFHSSTRWFTWNLAAERLRPRWSPDRWLFVRYEDLVASPLEHLKRIAAMLSTEPPTWPVTDEGVASFGTNHSVAGNPRRFDRGEVRISEDVEWKQALPARKRMVASSVTWPLLRRYGYPLWV